MWGTGHDVRPVGARRPLAAPSPDRPGRLGRSALNQGALDISRGRDGADETCRLLLSLDRFADREAGTTLDTLYYYWDALRGDGRTMPLAKDFRPGHVFGPGFMNWVHAVETAVDDPANFVMRDHGNNGAVPYTVRMADRRIADYPRRLHARGCMREYQMCRLLRRPLYHEIDHITAGVARHYTRILLPLADERGAVVRLAYAIRLLDPPFRMFADRADAEVDYYSLSRR